MFYESLTRLGAGPFLTYYGPDGRTELSGITFANWVTKTMNMIDDLGDVDEPVSLGLAETHPGHWVTLVWAAAAWSVGGSIAACVDEGAELAVVGPDDARRGNETVVCSLHPFGLALPTAPANATDYNEVLAQPDIALAQPAEPVFETEVAPRSDRRLFVDPQPGWEFLADALVAPILGGGSSVIAVGQTPEQLERIKKSERIEP